MKSQAYESPDNTLNSEWSIDILKAKAINTAI